MMIRSYERQRWSVAAALILACIVACGSTTHVLAHGLQRGAHLPSSVGRNVHAGTMVRIYLIALSEGSPRGGLRIGCGDSLASITRTIKRTTAPLQGALDLLLSDHGRFYRRTGLYNALYRSRLRVSSIVLRSGHATISLSGTLRLGGECDDPRVQGELVHTALQFRTVHIVSYLVNGKPLNNLLGGRGIEAAG